MPCTTALRRLPSPAARIEFTDLGLTKMMDHSLPQPTLADLEPEGGCRFASRDGAAPVRLQQDGMACRAGSSPKVQAKAAGGVRDLGSSSCGAMARAAKPDENRRREAADKAGEHVATKMAAIAAGGC